MQRPNKMVLKSQWVNNEIKRKFKNTSRQMKMGIQLSQIHGMWQKQFKGKFTATQAFLKHKEKSQIHNLTYHLKELGKKKKAQTEQKEGNNKYQRENKDLKKQELSMNQRVSFFKKR